MRTVLSLWKGEIRLPPPRVLIADIAASVANRHWVSEADLTGADRSREVARARQECYALAIAAGRSTPAIGRYFNRDHSTVIYGARAYRARLTKAEQRA